MGGIYPPRDFGWGGYHINYPPRKMEGRLRQKFVYMTPEAQEKEGGSMYCQYEFVGRCIASKYIITPGIIFCVGVDRVES